MMLASDGGPGCVLSWCGAMDFIPAESYPPGSALAADLPKALSPKKAEQLREELLGVYGELRLFAFEET
jgi:hypothetical protein